jgi:hypothetical protein
MRSVADRNVVMRAYLYFRIVSLFDKVYDLLASHVMQHHNPLTIQTISAVLIVGFPFNVIQTKRFMQSKP